MFTHCIAPLFLARSVVFWVFSSDSCGNQKETHGQPKGDLQIATSYERVFGATLSFGGKWSAPQGFLRNKAAKNRNM